MTAKHPLEPVLLLLAAGIGIGLVFPISKLADLAAIEPFAYIGWSAAGACLILFALCIATGRRPRPVRRPSSVSARRTRARPSSTTW